MNILSLGIPLFSSPWRAAGHRVLVLADIALGGHEDNLGEINTWRGYRTILSSVVLCVTQRPGFPLTIPKELRVGKIMTFPSPEWAISSTMIRRYIKCRYSCDYLLPPGVAGYIRRQGLYC